MRGPAPPPKALASDRMWLLGKGRRKSHEFDELLTTCRRRLPSLSTPPPSLPVLEGSGPPSPTMPDALTKRLRSDWALLTGWCAARRAAKHDQHPAPLDLQPEELRRALTALALFSAYKVACGPEVDLGLDNANVVMGLLIGAMLPFAFSAMAMKAVGKAANAMVEEVRRQFREIPGLKEGTGGEADYMRCVDISTKGALREMVGPGVLAVTAPIVIGMLFGKAAVGGMLAGATGAGVMMALFMANAGGAWDNAKKYASVHKSCPPRHRCDTCRRDTCSCT